MTRQGDRTGWYCWWRWDVTVLPGIVWLIGIRSPLQCLDSNAMQSHMAIYIQSALWAPTHPPTHPPTHTRMCWGKQHTHSSMWNTVIIFSSDTSPSCCSSSSGACWVPCCIQIQLFSCFSFSYFPCAGTNICTWQELLLRKWLSVLKFLCYLLQTLSQSTSPSFRRRDKIATQWKAQILRRHWIIYGPAK